MKVLTIAHNAVAESNRKRVDALAALPDVQVSLLTPAWWNEEGRRIDVPRAAPWRVGRTLFTGNGTRHAYITGLVEAMRAVKPDVIDLFEEPFSVVALQAILLRDLFVPRAAVVFYSAVNVQREWRWPYRWIERLVLRRADGAHAPNADVPRILAAKAFSPRPTSVIPLGVDVDRFLGAEPLTLSDVPRPRVGFVGRLEPVKGLDVLLDAFQQLATSASLVIAGEGTERQRLLTRRDTVPIKEHKATMQQSLHADERASTGGMRRVCVIPPVSYEQMPGLLKSFDVLVLPSVTILPLHREQFGRVLIEAMAAGVPVVGSSSGAIPEVIGDAGLVVPERDATALAQAIDRVLAEPGLRETLVQRGHERVKRHFAWTVVADQTLALFRAAVAHRRAARAHMAAARA